MKNVERSSLSQTGSGNVTIIEKVVQNPVYGKKFDKVNPKHSTEHVDKQRVKIHDAIEKTETKKCSSLQVDNRNSQSDFETDQIDKQRSKIIVKEKYPRKLGIPLLPLSQLNQNQRGDDPQVSPIKIKRSTRKFSWTQLPTFVSPRGQHGELGSPTGLSSDKEEVFSDGEGKRGRKIELMRSSKKSSKKRGNRSISCNSKPFLNDNATETQKVGAIILEEKIKCFLFGKPDLPQTIASLINLINDPRWVAERLIEMRPTEQEALDKFQQLVFALWEQPSAIGVVYWYLQLNPKDRDLLMNHEIYQEQPLEFIKLLAQYEIPDKLDKALMRAGNVTTYFVLNFLSEQPEIIALYKELEKFIPKYEAEQSQNVVGCLHKIYYTGEEKSSIRILPRKVVYLLDIIRKSFSDSEKYGDAVGLNQVSQVLFFSSINTYLTSPDRCEDVRQMAPFHRTISDLTQLLRGGEENESDNLFKAHREFIDCNSNFAATFPGESLLTITIKEILREAEEEQDI